MFFTGGCNNVTSGVGAGDVGRVCQGRSQCNRSEVSISHSFDVAPFNFYPDMPILNNCMQLLNWAHREP